MMTLDQWSSYLYKAQDKAFVETRDHVEPVFGKYTKTGSTKKADYRSVTGSKLGPAGFTPVGGQAHVDEMAPGTERVTKFKKLTMLIITPEELESDMYSGGRVDDDKVKAFGSMTSDMAESFNWAYEIIATDLQVRGTSTTATAFWPGAGRDGLALFSTSHVTSRGVPVTWTNYQTSAPMNALTLQEGITLLENIPDETGRPLGSARKIGIVYGRYWEWRVPELLKATSQPDTANLGNPNALKARYDNVTYVPILNPYLPSTNTSWMLIDMDVHMMMWFQKESVTYNRDVEPRTGNKLIRARARCAVDFDSAKGVLKNDGV